MPKGYLTLRPLTQLDPLDSILVSAIIFEIGAVVERRRRPIGEETVFSYRFSASGDGALYSTLNSWESFWKASRKKARVAQYILVTDIVDFYNQVGHHVIENQFDEAGVEPAWKRSLIRLFQQDSEKISKGIQIGPHATHLVAEMSLIPSDNFLVQSGIDFCRFVDDMHIFCDSEAQAHARLLRLAEYLDKTQKLTLNKQKTKLFSKAAFIEHCDAQLSNRPVNQSETDILRTVARHSSNPYATVSIDGLSQAEKELFSTDRLEGIIEAYLSAHEVDHVRLRWFLRRLAQVGAPGAVTFCVRNFSRLVPEVSELASYLRSAGPSYEGSWKEVGAEILNLLDTELMRSNSYLRIVLLGLFEKLRDLNHVPRLAELYETSQASEKRKIILAAAAAGFTDWLRRFKGEFTRTDPWTGRAMIFALRTLPADELEAWCRMAKATTTDALAKLLVVLIQRPKEPTIPTLVLPASLRGTIQT